MLPFIQDYQESARTPQICQPYEEPDICSTERNIPGSAGSLLSHIIVVTSLVVTALLVVIM